MGKLVERLLERNPLAGCYLTLGFRSDACPCGSHGSEAVWPYAVTLSPDYLSLRQCAQSVSVHNDCAVAVVLRLEPDWTVTEVYGDIFGLPPGDTWSEVCKPALLALASALHLLARLNLTEDLSEYAPVEEQYAALTRLFPSQLSPKER